MERSLRIESYRNIGFKDEKPYRERLVINNSLKKGELGDLVILIGANNSGKSNVLSALETFGEGQLQERDVTDLYMEEECRCPSLSLFARDQKNEDDFSYRKIYKKDDEVVYPESEVMFEPKFVTLDNFLISLQNLMNIEINYFGSNRLQKTFHIYSEKIGKNDFHNQDLIEAIDKVFSVIELIQQQGFGRNFFQQARNNELVKEYNNSHSMNKDFRALLNKEFSEKYGYNFIPSIIPYENEEISNNRLIANFNNISNSEFFASVLHAIDIDISTIKNAYDTFHKQRFKGVLSQLENKINKKLMTVSEKFNQLYFIEEVAYSFKIDLESENIFFSLYRGEQAISLDYQSTGFRWFFNLFFNLLNSTDLNPGDIIIMDEPATHLHVKGQKELRAFLKEFAIKNDVTIVIATHSPFLIDLDYLDEIRVIVNKDNVSSIENSFAAVNENDPDSLLPIKDSLTVENHVLINPDEKVVFVEGITDYNYLTAFKKLFGKTNITFLPINGVGKTKEDCEKISQRLMKIRKKDPILLVDNDKAGNCMKEVNKENKDFTILSLNQADSSFKTIESLFDPEDLKKFSLVDSEGKKHASTSTVFKNQVLKNADEISETTKQNFEKLFDLIFAETE